MKRIRWLVFEFMTMAGVLASLPLFGQAQVKDRLLEQPTFYRTIQVDGLSIFYREAGPKNAPTLLLLHGLPSSSRMFEPLFTRLSDRFHLVAQTTRDSDIAIGPNQKHSLIHSLTSPRS